MLRYFVLVMLVAVEAQCQERVQDVFYRHYSQDDGLPGYSCYGLAQDKEGFLWVGTNAGLARFDGTAFRTDFETKSLPSQLIDRIYPIAKDTFLILGSQPAAYFGMSRGEWWPINDYQHINSGFHYSQSPLDSSIVFSTYNPRSSFQINDSGLEKVYQRADKRGSREPVSQFCFKRDSFLIAQREGATLLGKRNQKKIPLGFISCTLPLGDSLLLFSRSEMWYYKHGKLTFLGDTPLEDERVIYSAFDRSGRIWFSGMSKGLYFYENGRITDVGQLIGLGNDYVTYLFKDRDGHIWVSTESSGLFYFPNDIFSRYTGHETLRSKITALANWKGQILVGTSSGLAAFVNDTIMERKGLAGRWGVCPAAYASFDNYVFGFGRISDTLIFGAQGHGNPPRYCPRIIVNQYGPSTLVEGRIITGRSGSLVSFGRVQDGFELIGRIYFPSTQVRAHFIKKLLDDRILVGTSIGLFITTADLKSLDEVKVPGGSEHRSFNDCIVDEKGAFWFATSNGLARWHKDQWKFWTMENELTSDRIQAIAQDAVGRFWLGTDKGLNVMNGESISSYTEGSGLASDIVTKLLFDPNDNHLWIGTNRGLSMLDLNQQLAKEDKSLDLYMTRFEIMGDTVYGTDVIPTLGPDQNNLRLHFALLNYTAPSDASFQCRLLPVDTIWRAGSKGYEEYVGLGPGAYEFQVRSSLPGTAWGKPARTSFTIAPHFWETSWFTLLVLGSVVCTSVIVFHYRLNTLKRRERSRVKELLKINHLEQRAMSLSMNPHFIFNTMNSIQNVISRFKDREAVQFVADFAKLIRLNMDSSRKREIELNEEVNRLKLYLNLEQSRYHHTLKFNIGVDPLLEAANPTIPNMMVQPLVENSIWHGILPSDTAGNIEISFALREPDFVCIEVRDNGVGLDSSQKQSEDHESQGLSLIKDRLAYLSARNYFEISTVFDKEGNILGTLAQIGVEIETISKN